MVECLLEAPDKAARRAFTGDDLVFQGGFATGELRPFRVSLLGGRD